MSVADSSQSAPLPQLVVGLHKAAAIARLGAHVAWTAVRRYRNPLRAARALRGIHAAPPTQRSTTARRARLWTTQKCFLSSGRYFWDLYAPGWPSVAFDRCIQNELERAVPLGRPPALNAAIIAISRRCALACEHCLEGNALGAAEALSADDLQEIVRRVLDRGANQIFFSGGEPLQRFDDLLSLAASTSAEADVWVQTSGRGLSAGKAQRLRGAGATGVVLSLDHWDAAAHDRFRGTPGSFTDVGRAALHARRAELLVALSLCPTRSFTTERNLRRYAETARALGAAFIQILEPRAVGRYAGRDVALDAVQQRLLEEFAERLNTDDGARDYPSVRYIDWTKRTSGCTAGDRYVYIDTQGEVHACPFCRVPGVRVLDRGLATALAELQRTGCPAHDPHPRSATRTRP